MLFMNDYGRCDVETGNELLDEVIEEAAEQLECMPLDSVVFICSSDLDQLSYMRDEFSDYGVDDVQFVTPREVLSGHLRGKLGILLVQDLRFLSDEDRRRIMHEQARLQNDLTEFGYTRDWWH